MADNVAITPGLGNIVAADEVIDGTLGTVKVQYVKIMDGTLDGTTKAAVGAAGVKVDGSGATQPVSAASLPLPSGASTAAKQPTLGTAGTPSADVISVQGIASMTPLKTDASATNQPVVGNAASGAADSGNPVKVGGTYNTTKPVLTNGQRGDIQLNAEASQIAVPGYLETPFSTTIVAAVAATDAQNYNWVSVQIVTQGGSSTVTFQGSNDNTNWVSMALTISTNIGSSIPVISSTAASTYQGGLPYRYFRLNVTGIASGTTAGVIAFKALGAPPNNPHFINSFGAGTTGPMKAEDAAHASGDQGIPAWQIRRDTPVTNANASADADYIPIAADNLGKTWTAQTQTEDAPHATGDRGSFILAVRNDANATLSNTDLDYTPISVDAQGDPQVDVLTLPNVTLAAGTNTNEVVGDVAQDAAVAGNPVLIGLRASTATPTPMSADGDSVYPWGTRTGALVIAGEIVDDAVFTPGTSRVVAQGLMADESSTDSVDEGDLGVPRMTLDRKTIVTPEAHTAGGATPYHLVSAASTNATSVKASAGQIYMITASNVNAAPRYLKLYNKASAPSVGSDTPVHTFIIPGNTDGAGTNIPVPACGLEFTTGIALALTTEATDAGSTGVAANEIVVNLATK
jgi:hypothetical protein